MSYTLSIYVELNQKRNKDFSFKKYSFWWQVLGSFFVTGVIIHLLCEGTGINKWYCKNGNACK